MLCQLEDPLARLADRDLDIGHLADADGAVRAPMSLQRLRTMLGRLLDLCPEPRRAIVLERLRWVESPGSERYPHIWTPAAGT